MGAPYGLEHASDDLLSGDSDSLFVRRITDLLTGRRTAGATLELTIDAKAQKAADEALGDQQGRGRGARPQDRRDPRDGQPPAVRPQPDLEPRPQQGRERVGEALDRPRRSPTSTAPSTQLYPPGSTFKVVTAAAALETGLLSDENSEVPGPGRARPPPDAARPCPTRTAAPADPNNKTTLIHALEISCNTAFGSLGLELGGEKIRAQAAKFGFGDSLHDPDAGLDEHGARRPQRARRRPSRRSGSTT